MAEDDGASANIESLKAVLDEAEIKAAAGDKMYSVCAKFLREKLASITISSQQPSSLPQSLRMSALNTAHTEAKENYKPEEKSAQKNLGGFSQVTVVSDASSDNCPTRMSEHLAGASPHAPSEKKQKDNRISLRLPEGMRPILEAKAAADNSYPSAYVLGLIAADLRIPIDEERHRRSWERQERIDALTVALNRQGNNFNQISKSAHEGKPCALSRPEISETLQQHRAAVAAIIKLGSPG